MVAYGTRLIITHLGDRVVQGVFVNGSFQGNVVEIPRIPLVSEGEDVPIGFKRTQFPLRLAFSMTINKAQGRTFNYVGLELYNRSVFTHGQLYVALSRIRDPRNLVVHCPSHTIKNNKTKETIYHTRNIVFLNKFCFNLC